MQSASLRAFLRGHPVCSSKENAGRFNKDESALNTWKPLSVGNVQPSPPPQRTLFMTEVRNMTGSNRTGRKKTEARKGARRERKAESLEWEYRELETTFYMLCPF